MLREFDGEFFWVGGRRAALIVDDMVSFDPFVARGVRVYGDAEQPYERVGIVGPGFLRPDHAGRLVELEHGG